MEKLIKLRESEKIGTRPILTTLIIALTISFFLPFTTHGEWVRVERVIDGDTFVTSTGTKVRIINIDTPETKHPTKPKEPGGEEATQLAKFFLEGNYVWLQGKAEDKYDRRLATVKLRNGKSYADIVRFHGYDKKSNSIHSYSETPRFYLSSNPSRAKSSNPYKYSSSEMIRINGYYRKDGKWISGYWRPKSTLSPSTISTYSKPFYKKTSYRKRFYNKPSKSPGSSKSYSRKLRVKGYYRKDGTYVKPHYRRKSGK